MKGLLIAVLFTLLSSISYASTKPRCLTIGSGAKEKISETRLDSVYRDGYLGKSCTTCVFGADDAMAYNRAWQSFLDGLMNYCSMMGVSLGDIKSLSMKVYFAADGSVDYFFYGVEGKLPQEKRFRSVVETFIKEFRFPVATTAPFKQCSTFSFETGAG